MENERLLLDALSCREGVYSLLWRSFAQEPDGGFVDVLVSDATGDLVRLYFGDDGFAEFASGVQEALRADLETRSAEAVVRDMRNAYVRLFVGPGRPIAAPWESMYVGDADQLFTDATLSVRAAYQASGFKNAGYPAEPDDHLATELSFMRALAAKAGAQVQQGDIEACAISLGASRTFAAEHLANWVPSFSLRLSDVARPGAYGFYSAMGNLLETAVREDARMLDELLALAHAL